MDQKLAMKKPNPSELEDLAHKLAPKFASDLLQIAQAYKSEADFRREAAKLFDATADEAGIRLDVRDEFHVASGRADAVYNRLVIEYERPGVLRAERGKGGNTHAVEQVKDYVLGVAKKHRREATRLAGVAMDGHYFIFVRRVGEGWVIDDPLPTTPSSASFFLRLLFSLSAGAALVPENLIQDFGPKTLRAQRAVRALYATLHSSKQPLVQKLFEQWRVFFSEATDYKEWSGSIEDKEEFRSFVRGMGLDPKYAEAPKVFFAIHTYYALLIKLVASLAAARFAGDGTEPFSKFLGKEGSELREAFVNLERGGLFYEYGIRNFLEGDFFGWYLTAWNKDIEEEVTQLIETLSKYDPGSLELAPENARDLLKKLYHYLLPREIRHDLGEYYTPDWLAERLIRQTLGLGGQLDPIVDPHVRVLDPGCGSGTFLVIVIQFMKRFAEKGKMERTKALELILKNVVGIDLNPLAVIAARTNYLIALGDLLKHRPGDIDIPVYQADSVLTPSRGGDLFDNGSFRLKTAVGDFLVPAFFAQRERMDALANILDEAVETSVSEEVFLGRIEKNIKLSAEEFKSAENDLKNLYRQLRDLHDEGLNGVWARIIKNSFAPLFLEPCDYIVGNPPWVNWESLPDDYRIQTKPLWEHYGLFPHGGMDTILGKGKKDISMLMTYVSIDRYLRRGGKLGFVLSQSLFKTSGAGQGFRRFILPDKTTFRPLVVEDMIRLNPFEGATNRTAVAVFNKGQPIQYPVSYQYWKKRDTGRGSAIAFDTPYEEVSKGKITFRAWQAEPVNKSDLTSAWITARPKALRALRNVLGNSKYSAHAGSFTGGTNAIYWVEVTGARPGGISIVSNVTEGARRRITKTQAAVETDLLYPLLRGRDVDRWKAKPSASILMTQDPKLRKGIAVEVMERKYPKAFSYLSKFEKVLRSRPAFRRYFRSTDPFWSIFNVSEFTFSPWKVVWREQASDLTAAVVGRNRHRPIIPDHKLMMVEVDTAQEAHYLCAALNSTPARFVVAAYAIEISMDTHILENVQIPSFSEKNHTHLKLAELSEEAHKFAEKEKLNEIGRIEEQIDHWAAKLWNLTEEELNEIKRSLSES